jgi:hypothetical protein
MTKAAVRALARLVITLLAVMGWDNGHGLE